jgi:hypothetical protein
MKTAGTVFWCSFFINQRGYSHRDILRPLFEHLVEKSPFIKDVKLEEKENYEREFVKIHDDLLDHFMQSIDEICDEWVESDVGTAFFAIYEKKK